MKEEDLVYYEVSNQIFSCSWRLGRIRVVDIKTKEMVETWNVTGCRGLALGDKDQKLVFVSSLKSVFIFSVGGILLRKWDYNQSDGDKARHLLFDRGELFVVDSDYDFIRVCSEEGKLLREFGGQSHFRKRSWNLCLSASVSQIKCGS
jgi:hypothetical protein